MAGNGREMPGYLPEHRALTGIETRHHGQAMFVELRLPGDSADPFAEAGTALQWDGNTPHPRAGDRRPR